MRTCKISELVKYDFNVRFINSMKQRWRSTRHFQCIGSPKQQDILLYIHGCTFTYTDKNNNTFTAESGDIVYTPTGSEYSIDITDNENADSYTVGINFFLFDEAGEQITLSDGITIFHSNPGMAAETLFRQAVAYDTLQPFAMKKVLLMEILCTLASSTVRKNIPEWIIGALQYISDHVEHSHLVGELAEMCCVSEVYFRKQFKHHIGMTPLEYRNQLRMNKARSLLEYGEISVQEISDMLGFTTVSYFIKEFRAEYGRSPLQYRRQFRKDEE